MNLKNLTFSHFEKMSKAGYSLDHVFLLLLIEKEEDAFTLCDESPKLQALYQSVVRKGLVSETGVITRTGKELLTYIESDEDAPIKKKIVVPKEGFENWWKAYPGTDTFRHKGKTFSGTRSLRVKKEDCKAKFDKILQEGEYTAEEMVKALEYEVLQKKENSVKLKTNKLTFMQNSLTYLNQRTFEPFIELVRSDKPIEEENSVGGTDI